MSVLVSTVCCELEDSATGRSLVQGSPNSCVCLSTTECYQAQQPPTPTISRQEEVRLRKRERKRELLNLIEISF
jgi:hypothetical protein